MTIDVAVNPEVEEVESSNRFGIRSVGMGPETLQKSYMKAL